MQTRPILSDRHEILGDEPTTRGQAVRGSAFPDGLSLLVVGDGTSNVHPLPRSGEVIIGRADVADIRIDDPSISRRHARLTIGDKLQLQDLDSANGTTVHGNRLTPEQVVEISPGVAVEVGSTVVIVQGRLQGQRRPRPRGHSARLRRIGTHGYFEVRLEEACTNAEQTRGHFSVLRVHLADTVGESVVQEILCDVLRPTDPIASYGPGEYEALLIDARKDDALEVAQELEKNFADKDARIRTGVASYPRDGRSPEALLQKANSAVQDIDAGQVGDRPIIVQDRVMVRLHRLIERVAAGSINVLLLGETGVGKEVLAHAVHKNSKRVDKPYIKMNCAALTESLFESELFGHEKGAFTGAVGQKKGLIEAADGGTFFLDEVGEMPMSIQAKLLTVIEDRQVQRVGALQPIDVDVRFVAATNRDLEEEVARGNFRRDLYYRLNGVALVIPPLRERKSEIEGLARSFIQESAKQLGLDTPPRLSEDALGLLESYRWPGNIRELRNVLERAVLLCLGETIEPEHFPLEKMRGVVMAPSSRVAPVPVPTANEPRRTSTDSPLWSDRDTGDFGVGMDTMIPNEPTPIRPHPSDDIRKQMAQRKKRRGVPDEGTPEWDEERQRIIQALEECAGNQSEAAKVLGVSRRTLVSRLIAFRIPRPRKPLPKN